MSEEGPKPKQFLFVDDDPDCLVTVTSLLKQMSKGRWAFRTATNHSEALEQLRAQPVDAVVLDVQMPVMDGIEFLRLLGRTCPGQQVVMLTGRVDETTRKSAQELGATLFLEKPTSKQGFQALYAALDSLAIAAPEAGFRGVMQRVELQDVLQMECLARKSSILVVTTKDRQGQIFVAEGEIIHAQSGRLHGEMALYGLLALRGGQFRLEPFTEPPQRTISGQYEFLLMEAARLRDETGSEASVKRGSLDRASEFSAGSADTPTATEARGVRIQEVLLSSPAGEVLYEWKCESIENRLELFKQLERKTLQSLRGSPAGRFQSVSMETDKSRLVIQIQPGFKLLVRNQLPSNSPEHE
jgi:CheY-like chemotaxis protein